MLGESTVVTRPSAFVAIERRSILLEGLWTLRRKIVGSNGELLASASGTALFAPSRSAIGYRELLDLHAQTHVGRAARHLTYRPTGPASFDVELGDGRILCSLDLARGRDSVSHDCGNDHYSGTFVYTGRHLVERWRAIGPNKDYVSTTLLTRTGQFAEAPGAANP